MRITKVEVYVLKGQLTSGESYWGKKAWSEHTSNQPQRYPLAWRMQPAYSPTIDTTVVRLEANDGSIGYGEAKAPVASSASKILIEELFKDLLLGADPFQPEVLWERMYSKMRVRGHWQGFMLEAISAVDIAVWDLMGQILDLPTYKLLGGAYQTSIPLYASSIPTVRASYDLDHKEYIQRITHSWLERGFKALKIAVGSSVDDDLESVAGIRELVGEEVILFVDAGWKYDLSQAKALARGLEELGVSFLEAPLAPEDIYGYAELRRCTNLRIAGGEWISTRYSLLPYLRAGAFDLFQPDVSRAGGITETKRMAQLADVYHVPVALHVSIGSAIHFAATAQMAAAIPNLFRMEFWAGDNPLGNNILKKPLPVENGSYKLSATPGLGISVDHQAVSRLVRIER